MRVHRAWLQKYFDAPLPNTAELADRLTFRAFEIEETEGDMLDVKVLPDRAAYALSHRGIAYELSAILDMPLKVDPLRETLPEFPQTSELVITTDPSYVLRHTGAIIRGVKVGPSPEWLKTALESVGQRSINNVVDALNYVLLDIGQPSGAFDLGALTLDNGVTKIDVRRAKTGEKIKVLTGEEYTLTDTMFVFTDAVSGELLDIAGIKGGLSSGVTEKTTDIFLSVGNYDPVLIRRAAQALKLFTDASQRFQNAPSPELTAYGMQALLKLIPEIAGGTVVGVVDEYRTRRENKPVTVTRGEIVTRLGRVVSTAEIGSVLKRLKLGVAQSGDTFTVTAPFERSDIGIPEDVTEEVGRILGYENFESKIFPETGVAVDQRKYHGLERIKDLLLARGFLEISTQSFAKKGLVQLANPLDVDNPFLRPALTPNMKKAYEQGKHMQPLVLEPKEKLKLFEIGTVFEQNTEHLSLVTSEVVSEIETEIGVTPVVTEGIAEYDLSKADLEKYGEGFKPKRYVLSQFKPFSSYPFVLRDIAIATPAGTALDEVTKFLLENLPDCAQLYATETVVQQPQNWGGAVVMGGVSSTIAVFDTFQMKDGRVSYGFRIVFQSMEKTLTDAEINQVISHVGAEVSKRGWSVR